MTKSFLKFAVPLSALTMLVLCPSPVAAKPACVVSPAKIRLGETVRVACTSSAASARLGNKTIKLFRQADNSYLGLLPISVKAKPGAYDVEILGDADHVSESLALTIVPTRFPTQNVKLSPEIEALHSTEDEMKLLTAFRDTISDDRFWKDPLQAPVTGCMTSPFGVVRLHNGKPTGEYHGGVDQRTPAGEPIRAIAAGMVKFARPFNVLGNAVGIDHGQGLESTYLHMSKLEVAEGTHVEKGDILGYAGSTGRSTGPHLHWVLYANQVNVNPAQWVKLAPCAPPPKSSKKP